MCKIIPRSSWTSSSARGNTGADETDGMPDFRPNEIKGICVHYTGTDVEYATRNPGTEFEKIRRTDVNSKGYGDIMYNLGVAQQVEGVYTLRGITNKGAANGSTDTNAQYLSILCLLGTYEVPTDLLLDNLRSARKLVLGKYPDATAIVGHYQVRATGCPGEYLKNIIAQPSFWDQASPVPPVIEKPTEAFSCDLPPAPLSAGTRNVNVTDLQNMLAYWGYYNARVDGDYGNITVQAVKRLQDDLRVSGKYRHNIDGQYGRYTRQGWCLLLQDLWNIAHANG